MKKFLVLYRAPSSAAAMMASATPEQARAGMDAWMAWSNKHRDAIIDLGMPLQSVKTVAPSGVADGGSDASGYSFVQADDAAGAAALVQDHPHLHTPGASIEVLEALAVPGM